MKKRTLSVLLAASMAASMLAGCGSSNGTAETTKAAETTAAADVAETTAAEAGAENKEVSGDQMIAMITDSGDITDESFNQITWETCVAYGKEHGIETEYFKPAEDTDEERINSIDLAIAEGATVVVMPGYLFGPAIAEEQEINPDVTFIGIDITDVDVVNLSGEATGVKDNVYICSFEEEQAGYLAGYGAVKDGYTSLGFLGGIAVPAVIRYGYGYIQGINDAAEEMGVDVDVKSPGRNIFHTFFKLFRRRRAGLPDSKKPALYRLFQPSLGASRSARNFPASARTMEDINNAFLFGLYTFS